MLAFFLKLKELNHKPTFKNCFFQKKHLFLKKNEL